jgi:uncharacterized protein with ParB-like and HNH nuclease domain
MFQTAKTIKELISGINTEYYLPAIQREFVWNENQIISLFDSLLKGFPIGSFLFWEVTGKNLIDFEFYNFIMKYNEFDNYHNEIASDIKNKSKITAILDGQQRITSILIGFCGSYAVKTKRKRYNDETSYPEKQLYISLSSKYRMEDIDDIETGYKLKFLTQDDLKKSEEENWFRVGEILDWELNKITKYALRNNLDSFGIDILSSLYDVVNSRIINYYLETSPELDKVLNIFVRINSGGTHLSYSDLLLSIATAKWDNVNARDEINEFIDEINNLSEGFNVSKDFILKTALFLLGRDMKFKVANFTNEAMKDIEINWTKIKSSILESFIFLSKNGFYHKNLISNYPATIISYFHYQGGDINDNQLELIEFTNKSLLKSIYSSSIDSVLSSIRKSLKNTNLRFSCQTINNNLPQNKKITFTEEDVKDLLMTRETQKSFILILSLLYKRKDNYTINQIIPQEQFKALTDSEQKKYKTIINYQLCLVKTPLNPFIEQTITEDKLRENYIDLNVEIMNVSKVLNSRQKNIALKLEDILIEK